MANKQNHIGTSGRSGNMNAGQHDQHASHASQERSRSSGARNQAPETTPASGIEALTDKVTLGVEQGKEALAHLKETVTEKVGEELDMAKTAVRDVSNQASELIENSGEALTSAGRAIVDVVKANPIPIALTGVGVTWLLISTLTKSTSAAVESASAGSTGTKSSGMKRSGTKSSGTNAISSGLQATGSSIERMGRDVLDRGRKLEGSAEQLMRDNPLMTGAVAFAAGTALGLAIPRTQRENTWFGEGRDRVVNKVQEMGRTALDKVESVAHAVTGSGDNDSSQSSSHDGGREKRTSAAQSVSH